MLLLGSYQIEPAASHVRIFLALLASQSNKCAYYRAVCSHGHQFPLPSVYGLVRYKYAQRSVCDAMFRFDGNIFALRDKRQQSDVAGVPAGRDEIVTATSHHITYSLDTVVSC